jgi:hypothetical protein
LGSALAAGLVCAAIAGESPAGASGGHGHYVSAVPAGALHALEQVPDLVSPFLFDYLGTYDAHRRGPEALVSSSDFDSKGSMRQKNRQLHFRDFNQKER